MKKQRIIALGLAVSMMALTACGGTQAETQPAATEAAKTEAAAEQAAPAASEVTTWPERGISMIVPFKAGGDTDFYGRLYAQYLEKELGVSVTVVNTEGAGGSVGAQSVADSEADGYTMLFYHTGNLFGNKMMEVSDLDQNSFEFACIGEIDDTATLVARKTLGFNTAEEFIEAAKAEPNKYTCAVSITGFSNFSRFLLEDAAGISLNAVDKGGASDMIPALMGDQIDTGINSYGVFKQYVDDGSIVPLVTYGEKRSEYFPDVPTAKELGYDITAQRAYFLAFPKGTDPAICQKLSDTVAKIQENEEYCKAVTDAYCVTPQFVPYDKTMDKLNELWAIMEPYTDALNG